MKGMCDQIVEQHRRLLEAQRRFLVAWKAVKDGRMITAEARMARAELETAYSGMLDITYVPWAPRVRSHVADVRHYRKREFASAGHLGGAVIVRWMKDGALLSAGKDREIQIYFDDTRIHPQEMKCSHNIETVFIAADGRLYAVDWGDNVEVWAPDEASSYYFEETIESPGHEDVTEDVFVLPDRTIIMACSHGIVQVGTRKQDGTRQWSTRQGHEFGVSRIHPLPDGRFLSGGADGLVYVWQRAEDGSFDAKGLLESSTGKRDSIVAVHSNMHGRIALADASGVLEVWDTTEEGFILVQRWDRMAGMDLMVLPDGRVVSLSLDEKELLFFRPNDAGFYDTAPEHLALGSSHRAQSFDIRSDGTIAVTSRESVFVFDPVKEAGTAV